MLRALVGQWITMISTPETKFWCLCYTRVPRAWHIWKKEKYSMLYSLAMNTWPSGSADKISIAGEPRSYPSTRHFALAEETDFWPPIPLAWSNLLTSPKEMEGKNVNKSEQHIFTLAKWFRGYTNNSMIHS